MATLHYGTDTIEIEDIDPLLAAVNSNTRGFVQLAGEFGPISVLISPGVPVWVEHGDVARDARR